MTRYVKFVIRLKEFSHLPPPTKPAHTFFDTFCFIHCLALPARRYYSHFHFLSVIKYLRATLFNEVISSQLVWLLALVGSLYPLTNNRHSVGWWIVVFIIFLVIICDCISYKEENKCRMYKL